MKRYLKSAYITALQVLIYMCIFSLMGLELLKAENLVLENDYLQVDFQKSLPAVEQYVLKSNNKVIYGDIVDQRYWAQVFHEDTFYDVFPTIDSITEESDRICYHLRGEIDSQLAVTFDLCYILSEFSIKVVFSNVKETSGYKLIVVRTPELMTVRATQSGTKLVFPYAEGRLIDIATTTTGYEDVDLENSPWNCPLLSGMLYYDDIVGVCSYDHLDMKMYARVIDHSDEGRLGTIGINFNYRYAPTNFDSASFIDIFDEETTNLTATLTFISDYDGDGDVDWMDGSKFLRDQVQTTPDPRYVSSFITKIDIRGISHISEDLTNIRKLYHLTDHNRIYGYLLDYNSELPFEIFGEEGDIDPDFASLADLIEVFQIAEEEYDTFLSFNDVYSDYYPDTPGYDPALRVIQADGTPYPGWSLTAFPEAFKADFYDYAVQVGITRVQKTLSRYPIKESYHIDALAGGILQDYSLESPANREKSRRGMEMILNEFNSQGVNITSEILSAPLVQAGIGWFVDTPRVISTELSFSDAEYIPLIEFLYHGKTLYGLYEDAYTDYPNILSSEKAKVYTFLEPLLLGANSAAHITHLEENDLEIDKFYLIDLPWMAVNQRYMENYESKDNYRKITYDEDTFVEIDYESNTYTVQVDGRIIGQNYTTFFPKDEDTFLIYSRDAKTLSETLPEQWGKDMIILKLTEEGLGGSVPFQITDRTIVFDVEADTPYKLLKTSPLLPDIAGEWKKFSVYNKKNLKCKLTVRNTGTEHAQSFKVAYYLSDDTIFDEGDNLIETKNVPSLSTGKSKILKFNYQSKVPLQGKYIIAVIDSDNQIVEINEENNTIISSQIQK